MNYTWLKQEKEGTATLSGASIISSVAAYLNVSTYCTKLQSTLTAQTAFDGKKSTEGKGRRRFLRCVCYTGNSTVSVKQGSRASCIY